ncbi:hypothetical protein [Pseudonocardia sp. GCM10023141]|uniref:hypothetical protein n=1 Tax=Pseudonocardia sp. GCM10023141 TaxID=3252653 RepID=UPI00362012F8
MRTLDEVGEQDGWRCWLCDEPVDGDKSVNDARGPSIDRRMTASKAKGSKSKGAPARERLAHRACNTGKGATTPVVAWGRDLFVVDPAPIIPTVERLERKGGREVMARCPGRDDAEAAADWLVDRLSRLAPDLSVTADVESGGGQYLLILRA